MEPKSIQIGLGGALANNKKKRHRKVATSGENESPKVTPKRADIVKKGVWITPSLSYESPWAPRGSQGALLFDGCFILYGFWPDSGRIFDIVTLYHFSDAAHWLV